MNRDREFDAMNTYVADALSLILIAATVAVALILYPGLPDPMPTHWNAAGEVDGYMFKPWGVVVLPLAPIFVLAVCKIVPRFSRNDAGTDNNLRVVSILQLALVTFLCGVAVLVMLEAKGHDTQLDRMIFGGVGLLFFLIGTVLGRIRHNSFIGIRTPWTLANDEVWARTNQLAGRLFMLAGLLLFLNAFIRMDICWTVAVIFGLLVFPVLYSYLVHRRIKQSDAGSKSS
jgi:uncharacterized membrane protein